MPKWYQNYSDRVKNFIIEMINPETQIVINDDSKINKVLSKKGLNREDNFVQKRPFFFKSYKSEIERIKDHIKNNQYLNGIFDSNAEIFEYKKEKNNGNKLMTNSLRRNRQINLFPDSKSNINDNDQMSSNDKLINLSQRDRIKVIFNKLFPGRLHGMNNLKSLYNSLSEKNSNLKKRNILRKIKTLSKESKNNFSESIDYKRIINVFEKKLGNEKIKKNKGNNNSIKNASKITNSNFNSSVNSKLHFKAAEEIAENKYDKKNKFLLLLPNLLNKQKPKLKNKFYFSDTNEEDFKNEEEESDTLYDSFYYNNPYHDLKKRSKYNPNLMKQLSKMAFEENNNSLKIFRTENKISHKINQSFNKRFKRNKSKILKDEDEVEIDGEIFTKTNQFNLITKKILRKCNIYCNKSPKNNNSLKIGSGKNMMTKGLSINSFIKKFNLRY